MSLNSKPPTGCTPLRRWVEDRIASLAHNLKQTNTIQVYDDLNLGECKFGAFNA